MEVRFGGVDLSFQVWLPREIWPLALPSYDNPEKVDVLNDTTFLSWIQVSGHLEDLVKPEFRLIYLKSLVPAYLRDLKSQPQQLQNFPGQTVTQGHQLAELVTGVPFMSLLNEDFVTEKSESERAGWMHILPGSEMVDLIYRQVFHWQAAHAEERLFNDPFHGLAPSRAGDPIADALLGTKPRSAEVFEVSYQMQVKTAATRGHSVILKGIDLASGWFLYHDPWPGPSPLMARFSSCETDAVPEPSGRLHNYIISPHALASCIYGFPMPDAHWDLWRGREESPCTCQVGARALARTPSRMADYVASEESWPRWWHLNMCVSGDQVYINKVPHRLA